MMKKMKKFAIVATTIGDGSFVDIYLERMKTEGVLEEGQIIIIPDLKTPAAVYSKCDGAKKLGAKIKCPTVEEQDTFLARLGEIRQIIPYNSDNRRNIGYLMALEEGCDYMISIDDDNFCYGNDSYFTEHSVVARSEIEINTISSDNGWYNFCDLLESEPSNIYPRGFPYHSRHKIANVRNKLEVGKVHVNEGLWIEDPDVDAITWLCCLPRVQSLKGNSSIIGKDTWAPINTQNTAVVRDAIAAFYFLRMGYPIAGLRIDRYGDIFAGYFCQACVKHLGNYVRFGTPLVRHSRNSHNYLVDLQEELACILLIEEVTEWLRELKLEGSTYQETYLNLAEQLEKDIESFKGLIWTQATKGYFQQISHYMRVWIRAVNRIGI